MVDLDNQLTRAWNARWNQDQVLWRIFGAFWPTNAILLAALFRSGGTTLPRPLAVITCAVGLFVALIWFLIQMRAISSIERLEVTAQRIEEILLDENNRKYALSPKLNSERPAPKIRARIVIPVCICIVAGGWLIGLILSLCA